MTKAEMSEKLLKLGLKRKYKPYQESPEKDTILLEVRRPARIVDGVMSGAEIDIYDSSTVRVWTSQRKKANEVAKANKFKVRLLDGEAELYIPMDRADEFLHGFGAKVKSSRVLTPEQAAAVAERFARARAAKKVGQATTS